MQLRIRARDMEVSEGTRHAIERRVRLVLGRHAPEIDVAQVTLLRASPPHDETANCCRIRLRLRHGESVSVEGHAAGPHGAAAAAAWRLGSRLDRRSIAHRRRAGSAAPHCSATGPSS